MTKKKNDTSKSKNAGKCADDKKGCPHAHYEPCPGPHMQCFIPKIKNNKSKELGVIFDMTVEDGDEEISVMDHGVSISIGHEGPFDMENILKLSKMLNQWLDKFQATKEFRPKKK